MPEQGRSYPPYIAELALPENRWKLRASVNAGYATALVFFGIIVAAERSGFVIAGWALYLVIAFKLATNAFAHLSLARERLLIEAGTINVTADVIAMTAAVYFTGAHGSPLIALYAIELSAVALLTNRRITLIVAAGTFVIYATMLMLVYSGVLSVRPSPLAIGAALTPVYFAVDLCLVAAMLGIPTLHTASILDILGDKERALEERNRALLEAGKQKSQLMANVTHELRTPIHGISGLCDLIESGIYGPLTDKQREAQRTIKQSARSLLGMIDDLLELSRAEAGKLSFTPSKVDLAELLPSLLATARWMQGTKARHLETRIDSDVPPIETDRDKLQHVVLNLLSNAVKFTEEGGHITLLARRAGEGAVAVSVEDDGIGIAEEDRARIFEAFHQVDASAERQYGGAGLGLSLVQRLLAGMGGAVVVESEKGKGTVFTVTLPVRWGER
ncbi:MAG: HAMP domain-containing sensor histidine kinase [Byssovorax sp.]